MGDTTNKVILGAVMLFSVANLPAEVYRWVDEQGQVHYEDRSKTQSSSGMQSYKLQENTGATSQQRLDKTRRLLNAYKIERHQAREQKEKKQQEEEKRKRNCAVARDDLRQYESYRRVYRLNKEGEREYLSDPERRALMKRSRDDASRWCEN